MSIDRQTPLKYETVTPAGVTEIVPDECAMHMILRVEGGDIRWRQDDVDPTATDGVLLKDGELLILEDHYTKGLDMLKVLGVSGAPTLHIQWYR